MSDLEALVSLADDGQLDLVSLLHEKMIQYPDERFDIFLHKRFGRILFDKRLHKLGEELLSASGVTFFLQDFPL